MINGKALKDKREKDELSVQELADLLGTKKDNIYKWEKGTMPRQLRLVNKIKKYMNGVSPVVTLRPDSNITKPSNGVPNEDYKKKYYELLEKYTALLEKQTT